MTVLHVLVMSGSLGIASSNTAMLKAAEFLAPGDMLIEHYRDIAKLPHFNPDLLDPLSEIIAALHARVARADGLLISCPEYARGIPGSFKNALDWLVSSTEFSGKMVALFNASTRASAA